MRHLRHLRPYRSKIPFVANGEVAPSMRDFVLKMCMDGQIVVNEDLRELNQELHRQGNNLNQLVRLALTAIPTILVLLLWAHVGLGI